VATSTRQMSPVCFFRLRHVTLDFRAYQAGWSPNRSRGRGDHDLADPRGSVKAFSAMRNDRAEIANSSAGFGEIGESRQAETDVSAGSCCVAVRCGWSGLLDVRRPDVEWLIVDPEYGVALVVKDRPVANLNVFARHAVQAFNPLCLAFHCHQAAVGPRRRFRAFYRSV
jgi:hypothetical protein